MSREWGEGMNEQPINAPEDEEELEACPVCLGEGYDQASGTDCYVCGGKGER